MTDTSDDLVEVRALFARETHGVLCTGHALAAGWPYGSLVPYALLDDGDVAVFVSDIAEHTRNLTADPRATLLVRDSASQEPQADARHAMMVRARRPDGAEAIAVEQVYFDRFPGAARMREAHGFSAWRLECERVRWIAGFGAMGWIDRASWTGAPDPVAPHAAGIVAHLNEDHADAMLELAAACGAPGAAAARAVAVDRGGLDLLATVEQDRQRRVRASFAALATTPDAVRREVVALLRAARG
ncbi:MAG: HugZ family protein [Planctomycetota bacterium]